MLPDNPKSRRLALAKWIAHPSNQLTLDPSSTAFGKGILASLWQATQTISVQRERNQPILSYLTGWQLTLWKMVGNLNVYKLIMSSNAYRMGTNHSQIEKLRKIDPNNHLLAYRNPRRLSAEELGYDAG